MDRSERPPNGPRRRRGDVVILCVDDDVGSLNAMRRCLRNEPYEVITAGSSDEAFGWLAELSVDLVIADERMPGVSGTELLREVRKRSPRTARALVTAHRSPSVVRNGLEAGVDTFFFKPWDNKVLRDGVHRLLGRTTRRNATGNQFDPGGEVE